METKGLLSQKVNPGAVVFVVIILAVPAFFWFRFLYNRYVVTPDQVSPQMAKMRDAMLQRSHPSAAVKRPATPPKAPADAHKRLDTTESGRAGR